MSETNQVVPKCHKCGCESTELVYDKYGSLLEICTECYNLRAKHGFM